MGQYWLLFNLDKQQTASLRYSKFGENFCNTTSSIFPFLVKPRSDGWSKSDRILLVGDASVAFPPRILSTTDLKRLVQSLLDRCSHLMGNQPQFQGDSDLISQLDSYICADFCEQTDWPKDNSLEPDQVKDDVCLVNLCNKEYIRSNIFALVDFLHPGLNQAILSKVAWSQDRSTSLAGPKLFHQGTWAGARLALMPTIKVERPGFVDITNQTFLEVHTVLTEHTFHNPSLCSSDACRKLRELQSSKYDPYSEEENPEHVEDAEETREGPVHVFSGEVLPGTSLARLESLPAEIHDIILNILPTGSHLAYTETSRMLYSYSILQLYRTVTLYSARHTSTLRFTLGRRHFLREAVKELIVTIQPHHLSRGDMHSILLQLPALKKLVIRPSWITYGPLMSTRYPFKLQHLSWGLIVDPAMNRFFRSQPTIEHLEFPRWKVLPPDWFYFWPGLLPNLQFINAPQTMREKLESLTVVSSGKCSVSYYVASTRLRLTEELGEDDDFIQHEDLTEE